MVYDSIKFFPKKTLLTTRFAKVEVSLSTHLECPCMFFYKLQSKHLIMLQSHLGDSRKQLFVFHE